MSSDRKSTRSVTVTGKPVAAHKRLAIKKGFAKFSRIHGNRHVSDRPDTNEVSARKGIAKYSSCA